MKRLGIFVFYDNEGKIDRYVQYYLEQMSSILDRLIIVSNSLITDGGKKILQKYSNDIIIRKNIGFDAGAYKDIIVDYLGKNVYKIYDQILLFNDTVYGPFYSMNDIFDEMDKMEGLDMWGITEQSTNAQCHEYVIPPHIQAYFLVFNKKLIMSDDFWEYWVKLQYPQNYDEAVIYFEGGISTFFRQRGYSLSVYCKPERLDRIGEIQSINNTLLYCGELIERYKCPFLKRKALVEKMGYNVNAINSMTYLKKLGYNTALIWENILRKYSILDIFGTMNLNYTIDDRLSNNELEKSTRIAVIIVFEKIDYIEKIVEKFEKIKNVDLFIVSDKKSENFSKNHFIKRNKENLFESYFILCANVWDTYDYVCCTNDRQWKADLLPLECDIRNDWIWNNLFYSNGYINTVIQLFESEKSLGMLLPYYSLELEYDDNRLLHFDERTLDSISKYIMLFDLQLANEKNKIVLLGQRSFWCRANAISNLLHKQNVKESFKEGTIIRDLLPYFFTANGQYPAYLNNSIYSGNENVQCLINRITEINKKKLEEQTLFEEMKHKSIYIYGAGKIADLLFQKCKDKNIKVKGFIVSDGEKICKDKYDIPIVHLSMIRLDIDDLVVIGVGSKIRPEIEKCLKEKNIRYL